MNFFESSVKSSQESAVCVRTEKKNPGSYSHVPGDDVEPVESYHTSWGRSLLRQLRKVLSVIGFTSTSEAPAFMAFSRSEENA